MKEFQTFILRGNVVDLAVGVVIGVAFGSVVTALVTNLITPLLAVFGGAPDFSEVGFIINGTQFAIGAFINALLSFVIVAGVVYYFVVVPMNKMIPPATKKICPECLSEIPSLAKRCSFCTSAQNAA